MHNPGKLVGGPREGEEGQLQLDTSDIYDTLLGRRPGREVLCSIVVTMADLYTVGKDGEAWNFVFGQARIHDGVGVYSFARYDPNGFSLMWEGAPDGTNYSTTNTSTVHRRELKPLGSRDMSLMLQRSCKVMTHETGHILGMRHCIYYSCLMKGCNNLEEFDATPMHLCPICLRKLQASIKCDVVARAHSLMALYTEFSWQEEWDWTSRWLHALTYSDK